MTEYRRCSVSPKWASGGWDPESLGLPLALAFPASPPAWGLKRMVLRLLVHLELRQAEKWIPVVLVPNPVPGDAQMALPPALARRVGRLTGAPSVGSPLSH